MDYKSKKLYGYHIKTPEIIIKKKVSNHENCHGLEKEAKNSLFNPNE